MATSIQSATKISDRPQAGGRRYVRYHFVCEGHDASTKDIYIGPKLVSADFDTDADITALGPIILARLAKAEESGITELNNVINPLTYALNPVWSSTKEIGKTAIYWMMRERDPRIVIYLEPLIEYIRTNYNSTQIANLLDLTVAQVLRMNRRINAILAVPSTSTSVKNLLIDFDDEEEDIV